MISRSWMQGEAKVVELSSCCPFSLRSRIPVCKHPPAFSEDRWPILLVLRTRTTAPVDHLDLVILFAHGIVQRLLKILPPALNFADISRVTKEIGRASCRERVCQYV